MSFKLKKEINDPFVLNNLMKDYLGVDLELNRFAMNMKKEVCGVIDSFFSFFSFLTKYDERRAHNILFLMLDSKYKSLILIFYFIVHEPRVVITKEHDRRSPFFRVLKSYRC
jgi:hypothetical protein